MTKTLYFPFTDGVQLIVMNRYDAWQNEVDYVDMMQPRGMSHAVDIGPPLPNIYIFRDTSGKVLRMYNSRSVPMYMKENIDSVNANELTLRTIRDYQQFDGHLVYYDMLDTQTRVSYDYWRSPIRKTGIINLKGEVVVDAQYDYIRPFQRNLISAKKYIISNGDSFGLLDSNFQVLFEPIYKTHDSTSKKFYSTPEHHMLHGINLKVFKDAKCGLIDYEGNVLIDFKYDDIHVGHDTTYLAATKKAEPSGYRYFWGAVKTCTVYDSEFKILSRLDDYESIEYKGVNRFLVKRDGKYGFVNMKNEVIIPLIYKYIVPKNGAYNVSSVKGSGIIDMNGKVLLPLIYEGVTINGKVIFVVKDGLIGLFTADYKEIAAPRFKYKKWDHGKYILTDAAGRVGFVNFSKENSFYQSPEGVKVFL